MASPINWSASGPTWITFTPASGALNPGASVNVVASINANANGFPPDVYGPEPMEFRNTTNGTVETRFATLTVTATAGTLAVSPSADFESSGPEGGPFSPASMTYTVWNVGGQLINWTASGPGWPASFPASATGR